MNYDKYIKMARENDFGNIQKFFDSSLEKCYLPENNDLRYLISSIIIYLELKGNQDSVIYFKYLNVNAKFSMNIPYIFYKNVSFKLLDDLNVRSVYFSVNNHPENILLVSPFKSSYVNRVVVNGKKVIKGEDPTKIDQININKKSKMTSRIKTVIAINVILGFLLLISGIVVITLSSLTIHGVILIAVGLAEFFYAWRRYAITND